jgi:hypothetical protein
MGRASGDCVQHSMYPELLVCAVQLEWHDGGRSWVGIISIRRRHRCSELWGVIYAIMPCQERPSWWMWIWLWMRYGYRKTKNGMDVALAAFNPKKKKLLRHRRKYICTIWWDLIGFGNPRDIPGQKREKHVKKRRNRGEKGAKRRFTPPGIRIGNWICRKPDHDHWSTCYWPMSGKSGAVDRTQLEHGNLRWGFIFTRYVLKRHMMSIMTCSVAKCMWEHDIKKRWLQVGTSKVDKNWGKEELSMGRLRHMSETWDMSIYCSL